MRNSLLSLLGLPLVAGFGGLSWVRTAGEPAADGTFTQPATVLRPPGDATFASGCAGRSMRPSAWKRGTSPDPDASVLPSGAHASASTGQSWHAGDALNCHDAVWCVCGSGLHSAVVRNQRESHIVMPPSKLAAATRRPSPE